MRTRGVVSLSRGFYGFLGLAITSMALAEPAAPTLTGPGGTWTVSKSYADVTAFMKQVVAKHPENAQLITIGQSDSGQPIWGVKIGDGPTPTMVVGTHHGNEYGSTEVAKGFLDSVAAAPIKSQTVYVIPVLNINGYNGRNRYESNSTTSFDPNRNYPGPCGTEGPFTLKSTSALAQFVADKGIVESATLHTSWPAVVYPWGLSTHDLSTPYDDFFKQLVQAATVESHYGTGNSTEVIYPADGTYEDYAFWKHGIWSILFELGNSHYPSDADVEHMIAVNTPGLRRMLELAPTQRAEKHDFTGKCSNHLRSLDRHIE